jgi:hypothetical protein
MHGYKFVGILVIMKYVMSDFLLCCTTPLSQGWDLLLLIIMWFLLLYKLGKYIPDVCMSEISLGC